MINTVMSTYEDRGLAISIAKRMSLAEFLNRANAIHSSRYDYSLVEYVNMHTHIKIICPTHGLWLQTPMDHIQDGCGCKPCGKIRAGIKKSLTAYKKFLIFANERHKCKYTYHDNTFIGIAKPMKITCPTHGDFYQSPDVHKRAGCQRCGSGPVSNSSQQWLDSLNVPKENREIWININNQRIKVDAFDKNTNTIFEYWGNYWHGNPRIYLPENINANNKKPFGELYKETLNRISLIKAAGYNLVEVWEDEWLIVDK